MPPELALSSAAQTQVAEAVAQFQLVATAKSAGGYRLVYTANTGCGGTEEVSGRHNLDNLRKLNEKIGVDYINTNYQSEKLGDAWRSARIPQDSEGHDVPGNPIATVALGGNSTSDATKLGKALLKHYDLSAFSPDVVLVFVTDPNDRRKDRVVQRFDSTFDSHFADKVLSAVQRNQALQQGRTGAHRSS